MPATTNNLARVNGIELGYQIVGKNRSGMTHHRLAILPGLMHYGINVAPALSAAVIPFLEGT